jgi:hypothetical protein
MALTGDTGHPSGMSVTGPAEAAPTSATPGLSPGPGVTPPFPAPPTEGRTARIWWGLGGGALALVLCCGGGVAAVVGLAALSERAFNEQAAAVIGEYLDAIREKEYDDAYRLVCDEVQDRETPSEFADRLGTLERIKSYEVGEISIVSSDTAVPVEVVYDTGRTGTLRIRLSQDGTTGEFEVCGVEE